MCGDLEGSEEEVRDDRKSAYSYTYRKRLLLQRVIILSCVVI